MSAWVTERDWMFIQGVHWECIFTYTSRPHLYVMCRFLRGAIADGRNGGLKSLFYWMSGVVIIIGALSHSVPTLFCSLTSMIFMQASPHASHLLFPAPPFRRCQLTSSASLNEGFRLQGGFDMQGNRAWPTVDPGLGRGRNNCSRVNHLCLCDAERECFPLKICTKYPLKC